MNRSLTMTDQTIDVAEMLSTVNHAKSQRRKSKQENNILSTETGATTAPTPPDEGGDNTLTMTIHIQDNLTGEIVLNAQQKVGKDFTISEFLKTTVPGWQKTLDFYASLGVDLNP